MKKIDDDDYSETKNWPDFDIKWDLNPTNFHHCLPREEDFVKQFPDEVLVGDAELHEIIENLNFLSKLPIGQSFNEYYYIVEFWIKNKVMTPPLFDIDEHGKIHISGGNHRFYVCR